MNWMLLGALAFLLAVVNLVRAIMGKTYGWEVLMFSSLSSGIFTMVLLYRQAANWVRVNDWSAIQDVIPYMGDALVWVVLLGVSLNLIAALLNLRTKG